LVSTRPLELDAKMKFLSYNLRNAGIEEEKYTDVWNNWRFRRAAVIELIRQANPDVLALQEDSDEQLKYIQSGLKESHTALCDPAFYQADSAYDAILVRNTIRVSGTGAVWICGDGKTQAKIDGSICFRHATYARLQLADAALLVVNVHLDHTNDYAVKRQEIEVLVDLLSNISAKPPTRTIVMGDFNSTPNMEPYFLLEKHGLLDSARLQGSEESTCIHWAKKPASERIDYIWLSDDLKSRLVRYKVISGAYRRQDGSAGHASDHSAVFAQFDL
jgi:endonuclease/exonuclease/phosphatase family metal-dependent hydrolase